MYIQPYTKNISIYTPDTTWMSLRDTKTEKLFALFY